MAENLSSDNVSSIAAQGNKNFKQEYEVQQRYSHILFNNQEEQRSHNSYEEELREMQSIETGNMEMLKSCWEKIQPTSYGMLSENRIRNIKNLCIVVVSFASRAAIRGGIHPEIAFSLCDSYVQEIEACDDAGILVQLTHRAECHYTELVIEANGLKGKDKYLKPSAHIAQCKKYIFSHLHDKLTVQEIAGKLHLNANYLSGLFKKYEGQTILQFVLKEKVKLAQNMLVYSNYSFGEIANYLGFSSQSHLGVHFKKYVHMTLGEYRTQYQSEIFQEPEEQ